MVRDAGAPGGDETEARGVQRGFALGYLAMLPLFVAYECTAAAQGGRSRNVAEVILSLPLDLFPDIAARLRWTLIALGALAAAWSAFQAELGLGLRLWRILLEGFLAAVLIGPCLLLLMHVLGASPGSGALRFRAPAGASSLSEAALVCGGSAYEEIVFRVGLHGLLFLATNRILVGLGAGRRSSRFLSEACAVSLSALTFAAAHLALFAQVLGPGGEIFEASVFTWRTLAGILLCGLFRWRGPGVAAWTHAFFNLALFIGAGPDVFL